MIKIEKDLSAIPNSIQLPYPENFPGNIPRPPWTTHGRRMQVIKDQKYTDNDNFNSRYKQTDVKEALATIYNKKCAYCENKMIQAHVEHYRPKNSYYWLAYSWDNLLLACSSCNLSKGEEFELQGGLSTFENNDHNIKNIHHSSVDLDKTERPKMVNPEVTDPHGKIRFEKSGLIKSMDVCFAYTIKELKIDNKPLNDERRTLIDKFKKYVTNAILKNSNIRDLETALKTIVDNFKDDAQDEESTFLAFRQYAIAKGWLVDIIREELRQP